MADATAEWGGERPYLLATFTSDTDTLAGSASSGTSDPIFDANFAPTVCY